MRARAAGKKKHRKKWSHVILMLSELCRCLWVNAGARWTRRMWFPASVMLAARCAAETGAGLWNRTLCQGCRRAGVPETSANPGYSLYTDWYVFSSASAGCFFLRFFYCFLFFPFFSSSCTQYIVDLDAVWAMQSQGIYCDLAEMC